ncbi:P-loop containing nucleoside triphosphate hydrolase protein [Dendrothele bispora CBS 962.96]|uniref:ATP-dependent DNA helicase n=1 Tax=Dendrothele bispora (strain CBS 962.96) TaxID=1314807 RepID=A0A4S8LZ53_DENBC|nr:P-loop containing nucleoside triphosphate hydrolase protein [Dendrothele bispora CBS 962.96]
MDSDDYSFEDDFDEAMLQELDAIEAAQQFPPKASGSKFPIPPPLSKNISLSDDSFNDSLDFNETELQILDQIEKDHQTQTNQLFNATRASSKGTVQTTLFGGIVPSGSSAAPSHPARLSRQPSGQQSRKSKKWDHTVFAKSGMRSTKKGKEKMRHDEEGEEEVEFEQFPAPFIPIGPPPPMKVKPDLLEAKHWIYPLNNPKRDYQFNIVRHCLFENTIVALPTGMGKTFVAGVVMLNYYRWFPDGKIVFVAPTKPLVAQQIEASHKTCGIPGSDAVQLTGDIARANRNRAWQEKRVFYMTPQTFQNDLATGNCDPLDIILLVVDEAHRATGDYAYNKIVRFMMAKNPHFRVLALTATPGGTPDAVQAIVDGLHISRIEIRDDDSLDLRQYIHEKKVEQHIISMSEDVHAVKDLLLKLMDHVFKPISRFWWHPKPNFLRIHPYAFTARGQGLKPDERWAGAGFNNIANLARVLGYLMEGTIGMCYTALQDLGREPDKPSKAKKPLRSEPLFQAVMAELESQRAQGFSIHPKMEKMKNILIQHFGARLNDPDEPEESVRGTKAMVFVTNRQAVDEVIEELEAQKPLIRASRNYQVIKRFKEDEFNVLVATSIGEEGLDIGEVDLIICYDAQKTPIRMLQRFGRTGRKRQGTVHVLLSEGREDQNMDKAKASHKEVQKSIVRGDQLELYDDVERLLPDNIHPQCLEKVMEIQEYVREEGTRKRAAGGDNLKKPTKRKRNDDVGRNIPMGASTGFVPVSELLIKGAKKQRGKKLTLHEVDEDAGEDDDVDEDLEAGYQRPPLKKSKSTAAPSSKSAERGKLRKSKTLEPKQSKKKKKDIPQLTASQLSAKGVDDENDMEIEQGIIPSRMPPPVTSSTLSNNLFSGKEAQRSLSSNNTAAGQKIIEISDSDNDMPQEIENSDPTQDSPEKQKANDSIAWLLSDDEDQNHALEIVDSSPLFPHRTFPSPNLADESIEFLDSRSPDRCNSYKRFDYLDDVEFSSPVFTNKTVNRPRVPTSPADESVEFVEGPSTKEQWEDMPPPPLPARFMTAAALMEEDLAPEPSFAVRPAGKKRNRVPLVEESPVVVRPSRLRRREEIVEESPELARSSRLYKRREKEPSNPKPKKGRSRPGNKLRAQDNPLYDFEAVHSGDDVSEGSSNDEDDEESESDRQFVEELPETQVSPSYNQTLAYRQSLLTQAAGGPAFTSRPVRNPKGYRLDSRMSNRRRPGVSSSPPMDSDTPDEYMLGSFVVDDEAEISYEV